ncbi:hypothetical protein BDQ17DRAFT_1419148 [Cyathus striatus]|nr:hypothetical protein BDQ17DRAFT_1419148 [Cyathus striatus]
MSFTTTTASFNVLSIGGSRNIGYFASLRLLAAGATVTFLLRNPSVFDSDTDVQKYIRKGTAFLVKGDALVKSDVELAWKEATANGIKNVDLLLFTVGGTPKFTVLKGAVINPPNLVTHSLINTLCTMPRMTLQPRIVVVSTIGTTRSSRAAIPVALKPVYGYLIKEPRKDKLGAERILSHVGGWRWNTTDDGEPSEHIIGRGDWTKLEGLPAQGELKRILLVRAAMLTDGECLADKKGSNAYRVSKQDITGWNISRQDVAHFVVDAVLNRWDEYENETVSIAY